MRRGKQFNAMIYGDHDAFNNKDDVLAKNDARRGLEDGDGRSITRIIVFQIR